MQRVWKYDFRVPLSTLVESLYFKVHKRTGQSAWSSYG